MDDVSQIKEAMAKKQIAIGKERAEKLVREGKAQKIFLAKNTPKEVKDEFRHLTKISGSELTDLEINSEELGIIVKKPYHISVLSILRDK